MHLFKLEFCQDICAEVELLDHMVALFLVFWRISTLFSIEDVPIYIPTNSVKGFPFFYTWRGKIINWLRLCLLFLWNGLKVKIVIEKVFTVLYLRHTSIWALRVISATVFVYCVSKGCVMINNTLETSSHILFFQLTCHYFLRLICWSRLAGSQVCNTCYFLSF